MNARIIEPTLKSVLIEFHKMQIELKRINDRLTEITTYFHINATPAPLREKTDAPTDETI